MENKNEYVVLNPETYKWLETIVQSQYVPNNIKKIRVNEQLYNYIIDGIENTNLYNSYNPKVSPIFGIIIEIDKNLKEYEYIVEYINNKYDKIIIERNECNARKENNIMSKL